LDTERALFREDGTGTTHAARSLTDRARRSRPGRGWRGALALFATAATAATAATIASSAHAQATASPEDIASARALGTEGVRLADAGDCASAVTKLEAAEQLYHAPTTLERLGECQVNLGHLVAGTETLNRVARETLAPSAPAAFVAAQHRAAQVLTTAQPRIGRLRIRVDGPPTDKLTVTVDGANVPPALFDADRATDPGAHEVKAIAAGYKTAISSVDVPPGAEASVWLKLEVDPNAPAALPAWSAPAEPASGGPIAPPAPPPSNGPNRTPAIISFAVGGAGIAVGAVFGILALGTKSTLDNECASKVCPASSQSDIDSLSTRATISNIGYAIGIVGVAVGTVLVFTAQRSEGRASATSRPPVRIRPWLGVGAAGLGGTFE
jgi:hypothetical protein